MKAIVLSGSSFICRLLSLVLVFLLVILASAKIASAQLNNTTNGPNAVVTNGTNAGASMTTGDDNSAYGFSALQKTKTGLGNTAVGSLSLKNNIAGSHNTAVGYSALTVDTAGDNTALGYSALNKNTTGKLNVASGAFALFSSVSGTYNTAETGANNAAFGYTSLYHNTASFNTAFGSQTLVYNTTGTENTATGYQALVFNTAGTENTANGFQALQNNSDGAQNAACGAGALSSNTGGNGNTAAGYQALYSNTNGFLNIAIGSRAGVAITTGNHNIDIGNEGIAGDGDTIRIGDPFENQATYIAGIAGQTVGAGGSTCYVDNFGKLGVFLSARRFKTDITDMANASDAVLRLRPVSFRYKPELNATGAPQFGLIAEEVAEVNPDLVVRDAKGELSTVRYEAVNAMLLNEFLKEHLKVEKLEAAVAQQQKDFAATTTQQRKEIQLLRASLAEQAAQIQKVGAQLEMSKAVPKTVSNNP
ncbi:MAG: hypothetical protein DME32_17785 [Verrucomicrobia bacterium]|nr:MAG: hypothetical protein DME32_17785 [Verrucomicrobiota bacterium]